MSKTSHENSESVSYLISRKKYVSQSISKYIHMNHWFSIQAFQRIFYLNSFCINGIMQFLKCQFCCFWISHHLSFYKVSSSFVKNRSVTQKAKTCHWGFDIYWKTNNLERSSCWILIDPSWFSTFAKAKNKILFLIFFSSVEISDWDKNRSITSADVTTAAEADLLFWKISSFSKCSEVSDK